MAVNKRELDKLVSDINKKQGKNAIFKAGKADTDMNIPRWSTGIADLDEILGGGMPYGRLIELFGAESSGKTSLTYMLCSRHEYSAYIPVEGTYDDKYAKLFNAPNMLVYRDCRIGEDALNKATQFAKAGIPLVVIDSIPALVPRDEFEKLDAMVDKNRIDPVKVGALSLMLARYMPHLRAICETTKTTMIFINQTRSKIGGMGYGEQVETPGGKSVRFFCSVRLQTYDAGKLQVPNKNPAITSTNVPFAMKQKIKVVKCKIGTPPATTCQLNLVYNKGYMSADDVVIYRKQLMDDNLKKYSKKKNQVVTPDNEIWTPQEEIDEVGWDNYS